MGPTGGVMVTPADGAAPAAPRVTDWVSAVVLVTWRSRENWAPAAGLGTDGVSEAVTDPGPTDPDSISPSMPPPVSW